MSKSKSPEGKIAALSAEAFQKYIDRFNGQDPTAFDDYLASDLAVFNGGLTITGVQGMKDHYAKIWPDFIETVNVLRYVSDADSIGVQMWTHFEAIGDRPDSLFGAVQKGETFDFRGLVMYEVNAEGKFSAIRIAYNSFTRTSCDGVVSEMGMPH